MANAGSRVIWRAARLLVVLAIPWAIWWASLKPAARAEATSEAYFAAGALALEQGMPRQAEACFRRYLAVRRSSPIDLARVGHTLVFAGSAKAALPYLEQAARAGRPDYLAQGIALDQLRRDDEAEQAYRQAVLSSRAQARQSAEAMNALGYFYAQRGRRLGEAVFLLRRALDLEPGQGAFEDSLGWAFYQMGDEGAALPYLKRATGSTPSSAEVRFHYGVALARAAGARKDVRDLALVELGKAVMLDPKLTQARVMLAQVRAGRIPPRPLVTGG